jgi:hypothetical protein
MSMTATGELSLALPWWTSAGVSSSRGPPRPTLSQVERTRRQPTASTSATDGRPTSGAPSPLCLPACPPMTRTFPIAPQGAALGSRRRPGVPKTRRPNAAFLHTLSEAIACFWWSGRKRYSEEMDKDFATSRANTQHDLSKCRSASAGLLKPRKARIKST